MWAFRLVAPGTLEKVRVPAPNQSHLGDGQVLVRLAAGGLCGSDLPYFRGQKSEGIRLDHPAHYGNSPPGVSLHEIAGDVVASRDGTIRVGAPVVGWATGMNGLAEYVVTDGSSLAEYDPAMRPTMAVMLQPLACVIYAVDQLSRLQEAKAAVLGLGSMGLLFAHVMKSAGARSVVGVDRVDRAGVAGTFLMDEVVHATCDRWVLGLAEEQRPDVVVEAIGHQISTLAAALSATAQRGEIFYFGVPDDEIYPISMTAMLRKNLTLRSGTTLDRRKSLNRASGYVLRYPDLTKCYVTDIYPVEEAQHAYERALVPSPGRIKVVLEVA